MWSTRCIRALNAESLFESSEHMTRFQELMDCFSGYPFFSKGICKCMYMAAWDDEHFAILLETLTELSLGRETNSTEMRIKGAAYQEEYTDDNSIMYELSNSFLDNTPFHLDPDAPISEETRYIIKRTLLAALVIDETE